jgi:hypothetical protein
MYHLRSESLGEPRMLVNEMYVLYETHTLVIFSRKSLAGAPVQSEVEDRFGCDVSPPCPEMSKKVLANPFQPKIDRGGD